MGRASLRHLAVATVIAIVLAAAVACTPTPTRCPAPHGTVGWAPGAGRTIALTFDDGPGVSTPQILTVLRGKGVRATFFDTGLHDSQFPATTRHIAAEGEQGQSRTGVAGLEQPQQHRGCPTSNHRLLPDPGLPVRRPARPQLSARPSPTEANTPDCCLPRCTQPGRWIESRGIV